MNTPESFHFFKENGYLHLKNVLSEDEVQSILNVIEQAVEEKTEKLFRDGKISNKNEDLPVQTRWVKICEQHRQRSTGWNMEVFCPAVYQLCTNPKLLELCEAYLGPDITLNGDFWIRPKLPHEDITTIPWHQDASYYNGVMNNSANLKVMSIWIPFVDVDERNGCMQVIRGSHRWGLIPHSTINNKKEPDENVEERGEVVTVRMNKGDLLLFNQLTVHRSLLNVTEGVRWSIDIRYTPTEQEFTYHELGPEKFDLYFPTLRVRNRDPKLVQNWEDWNEKNEARQRYLKFEKEGANS